jgi:hypothetical protein
MRNLYKPEGTRPLGRPKHRWDDNINMKLTEQVSEGAQWIRLILDRISGGLCEHGNELSTIRTTISFSQTLVHLMFSIYIWETLRYTKLATRCKY